MSKKIILIVGLILIFISPLLINHYSKKISPDSIKYNNNIYIILEYNMDIFMYLFNNNNYYEEDIIHHIDHNKWDIVYFNGDLFILNSQVKRANKYYANDINYKWFIYIEEENISKKIPIILTKDEIKYIYQMENMPEKKTIKFEDIERFSDLVKESNDSLINAVINLIYYNDAWYWKTEIMTDDDEEYIIELPASLNSKLSVLLEQ